ncbi:DUF3300 domain-containing protein [Pseudomonas sp. NPDC090233]|uniref:DUF3300 domain-containing protein n=1 Tax=Pseudomonas sp. NPDC090233 TaxID=3364479 RepID=UPI00383A54AE
MRMPLLCVVSAVLCLSGLTILAQAETSPAPAQPAEAAPAKQAVFNQEQLDQMLAPIALYPDALLAQVLMAATYPGEVGEAVAWSKANPKAQGDDAVKQVAKQPWDPSVQALVAFPQVLVVLGQDPVWVQRLGDAFLAQPDDVMGAVQRLRQQAKAAGNLQSNQYQNVTVQAAPAAPASSAAAPASTIIIQPADPQVVYVPTYNPTTSYGTWAYPASPPVYYPPSPLYYAGSALVAGLAFGTGVAIVNSLWGDCDWGLNDIDIDVNRYNNINVNNRIGNNQNTWQHNAVHRDGVPYRDNRSRQQYGRQLEGASQRAAFRGDNAQRAQARDRARASMDRAGIERPATSNRQARDQVREAQTNRPHLADRQPQARGGRDGQQARQTLQSRQNTHAGRARNNAFEGVRSPSRSMAQIDRGRTSQMLAQRPHSARAAGHAISRPSAPMRRGGGGRR